MSTRKFSAVFGLAAVGSMILSACGSNATPIVVTAPPVVVKETVVSIQKEQSTVIVTQAAPATATPRPEWSTPHPILSNADIRKAIAQCANRDELIKVSYAFLSPEQRKAAYMDTFIPADSAWFAKAVNPQANIVSYKFDLAAANKLLDGTDYKLPASAKFDANGAVAGGALRANAKGDLLQIRFTTTNAAFRQTWGAAFVSQMSKCGIAILPSYIPGSIWFGGNSGLRRRDFELGAFAWVGETDPPSITLYACDQIPLPRNNWDGQNYMGWCNEKASNAIKQAANTLDVAEAKKLYAVVQEEFSKDMVSLPIFQRVEANGFAKALKGAKADPTEYWSANAAELELPGKDTIVAALGQEPASLFLLQESAAVATIVGQLVFGASFTQYNYDYQPVAFKDKKFPVIGSGATNAETEIKFADGAKFVDANGDVVEVKGGKLQKEGKDVTGVKVLNLKGESIDAKDGVKLPQLVVTYSYVPRKWHDGTPVTKADWELGYKIDCVSRDSGATSYFTCDRIQKVEAVDDNTVKVTWVPGYQNRNYFLGPGFGFYPSQQVIKSKGPYEGKKLAEVAPKDFKTLPEIAETPLGTGPFKIVKWNKGQSIELAANPDYFAGAPKAKAFKIQIFDANPAGAVAALLTGSVDIVGKEVVGAGAELEQVVKAGLEGKIQGIASASPTWEHIDMNLFVR